MPCEEWYELVDRYRSAAKVYSKAIDGLNGADFNAAWQSAEEALKNCRIARAALLDHEHDQTGIQGWYSEIRGNRADSHGRGICWPSSRELPP